MDFGLLFVGSPLLDILFSCEPQYLEKYGLQHDDCILADESHQSLFSDGLKNPRSTFQAGGSSQNSARVCKWILGDRGRVSFAGCVGVDDVAIKMTKQLRDDGVDPIYAKNNSLPTGVCICLMSSAGNRSMVTELGAGSTYTMQHLQAEEMQRAMEKASIIFVEGYLFSHAAEVVKSLASYCHRKRKLFALSMSAVYVCKVYWKLLSECMPFVDIIFGNLEEAKVFLELAAPGVVADKPVQCADALAQFKKVNLGTKRIVVITDGPNYVGVCESGKAPMEFNVPKVEVVEMTGCGDALAGSFLASYVCTNSVFESLEIGIEIASKMTQVQGCTIPK